MTSASFALNYPQVRSNLALYIEQELMNRSENTGSKTRLIVRRVLQTAALSVVAIGRTGVMMICLDGAANILGKPTHHPAVLGLGISNGIGNIVAFGVLSAYTTLELIEELTRSVSAEEAQLIAGKIGPCARKVIGVSSLVIGLLAQVPMAYAAYRSAFYSPVFNYIAQQLDFGRTAFSTSKTLEGLAEVRRASANQVEAILIRSKENFMGKIAHCRDLLCMNDEFDQRTNFLNKVNDFPDMESLVGGPRMPLMERGRDVRSYEEYLEDVLNFSQAPGSLEPSFFKKGGVTLEICVVLMTMAVLAEMFQLTRAGAVSLCNSEAFTCMAGVLVVLANMHILYSLIRKSTRVAMDSLQGKSLTPITCELMPRTYKVLTTVGVTCSLFTFVPDILFAKLYFPTWAVYPIGGFASLGMIFTGIGAVRNLRDLIIRSLTKRNGGDILLETDEKLEKLHKVLSSISLEEYGHFLNCLPRNIQKLLIFPEPSELREYLSGKELLSAAN